MPNENCNYRSWRLCRTKSNQGFDARASLNWVSEENVETNPRGEISNCDLAELEGLDFNPFADVEVVIHTAHTTLTKTTGNRKSSSNTEISLVVARTAINAGVKRFIYISSIKVNGEGTANRPFTADSRPNFLLAMVKKNTTLN